MRFMRWMTPFCAPDGVQGGAGGTGAAEQTQTSTQQAQAQQTQTQQAQAPAIDYDKLAQLVSGEAGGYGGQCPERLFQAAGPHQRAGRSGNRHI